MHIFIYTFLIKSIICGVSENRKNLVLLCLACAPGWWFWSSAVPCCDSTQRRMVLCYR